MRLSSSLGLSYITAGCIPFLGSLESVDLPILFLVESCLFLKGNGTFVFVATGLGGKDAGRDIVGMMVGVETSSSSPSSGDEVAGLFEALFRCGDLEAILLRRLGAMSSSPPTRQTGGLSLVVAEEN